MGFLQKLKSLLGETEQQLPDDLRHMITLTLPTLNQRIEQVEQLASELSGLSLPMALCHADLHNWNMMKKEGQLILIDWEGLKLAPVEADMMFLVENPYYDKMVSCYQNVHKGYQLNHDALRYYKERRRLEDIEEFLEQLAFDKQSAEDRGVIIRYLTGEIEAMDKV